MLKKFALAVLGVLVITGVLAGTKVLQISALMAAGANAGAPVVSVAVDSVKADVWEQAIPAVGSVSPYQGITVVAEAEGAVRRIEFEAGSVVKAGQILLEVDSDVESAQLRSAEATAELAATNLRRARELLASRTISQAEFDSADAALKQAQAQADNIRAVIAKKTVRAPFAGRLGIRQVSLGQFLNKGEAVVSLQALDPVFVEFSLPQQHLTALSEGLEVRVTTDAVPEQVFTGRLTAINPDVDRVTRSLRLQATLANPDGLLRPGMYVNAEVVLPEKSEVLIVPITAVLRATFGDSVFVVEPAEGGQGLVARQQLVRTGETRGDFVVVTKGLSAGQRIVTSGAFKLRSGASISESTVGVVEPSLHPQPPNT